MEFENVIGIDVGKEEIQLALLYKGEPKLQASLENKPKNIKKFFKEHQIELSQTLICMEHTGIYNNHLLEFCTGHGVQIWLENPVHIKRSIGMTRGKSDKVDALRIATFAYRHQSTARLWTPKRPAVEKLKTLMAQRRRLLKVKMLLEKPITEAAGFCSKETIQTLKANCRCAINGVKQDLKKTEQLIRQIIQEDAQLKELFTYITSVPNIGTIIGTAILVATNEFKDIKDPRKFACHCGIAPFEHTSGISIRGKTRVSHLANKDLKTLLHMAAVGSTSRPGEFVDYFKRKASQGKNKMLVLNAIRNKLLHRVFACVRDKKNYQKPLAYV